MEFINKELELFTKLEFPYSVEFKNLRKQIKPNLKIENENQSLYSIIKYIRNDLIYKKLKEQKSLVFDKYINEVLRIDINVDSYYPPENLNKLDRLITELKNAGISETHLNLVLYYILKDFSFSKADESLKDSFELEQYNLINSIYFLDRFDLLKSLNYLNTSNQFNIERKSFFNHIIRLANIIPFQSELNLNQIVELSQIQSYLEISSSSETSLSVISVFSSLNINPLLEDLDIQLIYLDAITDISVNESLNFYKSLVANYVQNLNISKDLILKIILTKILIKTSKQRLQIAKLSKMKLLDSYKLDQLYESLPIFQLFNFQNNGLLEAKVIYTLDQVLRGSHTKEEELLRLKFPHFWSRLDNFNKEIRSIATDVLALKEILSIDTDPQEILALSETASNVSMNPKNIGLKDLAVYLAN